MTHSPHDPWCVPDLGGLGGTRLDELFPGEEAEIQLLHCDSSQLAPIEDRDAMEQMVRRAPGTGANDSGGGGGDGGLSLFRGKGVGKKPRERGAGRVGLWIVGSLLTLPCSCVELSDLEDPLASDIVC